MTDDNPSDKPAATDPFAADRADEAAKPVDPVKRTARRIVRVGVAALIAGFLTTFAGAVLLGNGPGNLEGLGNVVHRGGMFLMLGSLVVIVVGYRWEALAGFINFSPATDRRADIHELLRMLPPPPNSMASGASPGFAGPADASDSAPSMVTNGDTTSNHASWPTHSSSPMRPSISSPAPPSTTNVGCLVAGWSMLGMVFLLALIPYVFDGSRVVFYMSLVVDCLLLIGSSILMVELRGRARSMLLGATVPLALYTLIKGFVLFSRPSINPYGIVLASAAQFRMTDLLVHGALILFSFWGLFVHATIDFFRQRRQSGYGKR